MLYFVMLYFVMLYFVMLYFVMLILFCYVKIIDGTDLVEYLRVEYLIYIHSEEDSQDEDKEAVLAPVDNSRKRSFRRRSAAESKSRQSHDLALVRERRKLHKHSLREGPLLARRTKRQPLKKQQPLSKLSRPMCILAEISTKVNSLGVLHPSSRHQLMSLSCLEMTLYRPKTMVQFGLIKRTVNAVSLL